MLKIPYRIRGNTKSWAGEVAWMNPPYGDEIAEWMAKAFGAALYEGATVVCRRI